MAQISNITVFDGASPPVSHLLVAQGVRSNGPNSVTASWREVGLAVPTEAQPRLSITLEKLKSGVYRVERMLEIPVMETTSGANAAGYTAAPRVAHVLKDTRVSFFSGRSDFVQRRMVRQMGTNLDNGVSTSVAPGTAHAIAELWDLLITPT